MDRLDHLQSLLSDGFRLICQHEEILQTTSSPEARLNSERWIAKHWRMLAIWIAQARAVCHQQSRQMPQWLLENEAAVPPKVWSELKESLYGGEHLDTDSFAGSQETPTDPPSRTEDIDMAKIIQFPAIKSQDPSAWNESALECARVGLILQQTHHILERRRSFRIGELSDIGSQIGRASVWANQLETMILHSPEVLLQRTARRRAVNDLRHIRDLAEQIEIGLSNLDVEITLCRSLAPHAFDTVYRNMRTMDHYLASACDWMTIGRTEPNSI